MSPKNIAGLITLAAALVGGMLAIVRIVGRSRREARPRSATLSGEWLGQGPVPVDLATLGIYAPAKPAPPVSTPMPVSPPPALPRRWWVWPTSLLAAVMAAVLLFSGGGNAAWSAPVDGQAEPLIAEVSPPPSSGSGQATETTSEVALAVTRHGRLILIRSWLSYGWPLGPWDGPVGLFVEREPNWATQTPTPEPTPTTTPTATPTATRKATPEATPTATPKATPEASPEASPMATLTAEEPANMPVVDQAFAGNGKVYLCINEATAWTAYFKTVGQTEWQLVGTDNGLSSRAKMHHVAVGQQLVTFFENPRREAGYFKLVFWPVKNADGGDFVVEFPWAGAEHQPTVLVPWSCAGWETWVGGFTADPSTWWPVLEGYPEGPRQ